MKELSRHCKVTAVRKSKGCSVSVSSLVINLTFYTTDEISAETA